MGIKENYQSSIEKIDKYKFEKIKPGSTINCKKMINGCYGELVGKEAELELELYERKAVLIHYNNHMNNLAWNIFMLFVGAIVGVAVGSAIDGLAQDLEYAAFMIKGKNIFNQAPMEILNSGIDYKKIAMLLFCLILVFFVYYILQNYNILDKKNNIFISTMIQYELDKIEEILKKL